MKVLITADPFGGVWTHLEHLVRGSRGDVEFVVAVEGGHPDEGQLSALAAAGVRSVRSSQNKLEWMQDPWRDIDATGSWLLDVAQVEQPDVVHLNSYAHATLGWKCPVVVGAHSCVFSWWIWVKGTLPPPEWAEYRRRVRAGVRDADIVVAPTRAMLDDIKSIYGFDGAARVVHNGCDPLPVSARPKEDLIVCAGRLWDEGKNVATLEAAAPHLRLPVVLVGEQRGPRSSHVTGTGRIPREDVLRWFERAAIFCEPARYEPFGLSALEAASSGCALVLGDIPSLREVWGDAALFVPPDDVTALRDVLDRLAEDRDLLEERQGAAFRRARSFTVDRMVRGYLDVYRCLLTRRASATAGGAV